MSLSAEVLSGLEGYAVEPQVVDSPVEFEALELDLENLLESIVDPNTNMLRDLKVDDRDFPEFPNVASFIMDSRGLNLTPFSRQLWIQLQLFHEWCPRCTKHKKWMRQILDCPVDIPAEELLEGVQLLHHGKCPKCGLTKLDFFKSKELAPYQELAALLGQRVGKCVTGDTRVLTTDGMRRIDSFFDDHRKLGFVDYTGCTKVVLANGKTQQISRLYRQRAQRLIEITTAAGHQLTGTAEHPLFTADDRWVKLRDLHLGSVLPITVGQNRWARSAPSLAFAVEAAKIAYAKVVAHNRVWPTTLASKLTQEIATALGYFVSEGSYTNYRIYNNDRMVIAEVAEGVCQLLGRAEIKSIDGIRHYVTIGTSVAERAYVDAILGGSAGLNSRDKTVPEVIFQAPLAHVRSFLSAMFEGDGCVNGKAVQYTTLSLQLARDVHHLLSNLGIISRVRTHSFRHQFKTVDRRERYYVHNVSIEGVAQLKAFADLVGFRSGRKRRELAVEILRAVSSRTKAVNENSVQPSWYEKAPALIGDTWKTCVLQLLENFRDQLPAGHADYEQFRRNRDATLSISKRRVLALEATRQRLALPMPVAAVYHTMLQWASSDNMYFTEVVSRRLTESQQTFDFEVAKDHQFVGNGLVNHNSTMLVAPSAVYTLHKFMKIPRPWELYGLNPTTLFSTLVAQTYQAAYDQLWLPVKTYIEGSDWFCIEESTPVLLSDGTSKPIRDIQEGDQVRTLEGSSVVEHVFDNGVQDVWELELEDGTLLQATAEHQIRCLLEDGTFVWKTVAELNENDRVVCAY